ncbi:MAG: FAD-binding protein [Nanoarchaeota archaeon]
MLIVGTGISGSVLAYESQKLGLDYLILTSERNSLANTSSMSNAHCRIPDKNQVEECVRLSVEKCGDSEDCVRYVYERADLARELYDELGIDYERRSFGIIPIRKNVRQGYSVLKKLQENIESINENTKLVGLYKEGTSYRAVVQQGLERKEIKADKVIFATGGFGGRFKDSDCFRYKDYNSLEVAKNVGANLKNLENVFFHPFGYNNGKSILTGKESSAGEFFKEDGSLLFTEEMSKLVRADNYHERFEDLEKVVEAEIGKGGKVLFRSDGREIVISPSAHYTAGGIETDKYAQVKGGENLYAIGECRADGSRNGGRLPGYAFTEAIVHGLTLARSFAGEI